MKQLLAESILKRDTLIIKFRKRALLRTLSAQHFPRRFTRINRDVETSGVVLGVPRMAMLNNSCQNSKDRNRFFDVFKLWERMTAPGRNAKLSGLTIFTELTKSIYVEVLARIEPEHMVGEAS
ncbi:hypothetical protein [Polaromonas sp.]|uniref:hypothetical protein n=1 Tax=Polaromonas sp. TaxID=1869339 RepID=UPI00184CC191|nr:hypothetical protein [Polaromonas sp.]NMM04659.1 hypothetical protein [Polaromonas sp.]